MKKEVSTSSLIAKTVVVLVILSLFFSAVVMVFFPGAFADFADDLGMEKVSIAFEKVSYEKTGDINTLATILNYEIFNENSSEVAEYGMEMLNHKDYANYVNFLGVSSLTSMSYNVYCETYILQALYAEGMQDEGIALLSNSIQTSYQTFGVGTLVCADVASAGDEEFASKMLEIYESNFENASDIKAYNIAIEALILTEKVCESEAEIWEERLEELNAKFA